LTNLDDDDTVNGKKSFLSKESDGLDKFCCSKEKANPFWGHM